MLKGDLARPITATSELARTREERDRFLLENKNLKQ